MAHEISMFVTAMVAFACLAVLSRQGYKVIKQRRQFSLRDMLIVVTLVAALAGLMIGMGKEEKDGIPRFRLSHELERQREAASQPEK
jgi:hypothetical protein